MKFIVGNWKSNKTLTEAQEWVHTFSSLYHPKAETQVIIALPFPYLFPLQQDLKKLTNIAIATQDISPFPPGAYTGAVNTSMVKEVASYALIGHSERREYFHETNQEVANKVTLLLEAGMTPIMCVDEPYAKAQVAALTPEQLEKIIIAYEPLEAIGSGQPQDPADVARTVETLYQFIPTQTPIIYGGSINDTNAHIYLGIEHISGLLPGGASLDPQKFNHIIHA